MSALALQQREFLEALFDEGTAQEPGLAVYRGNVFAGWRDALAATYPVVLRLVGDAFFAEAASRYARAHPSVSGDLHEFGGAFADFLSGYPHASGLAYLPDVARLEWACHESYHAADAAAFDFAALAAVAEERRGDIRFRLHPSVRLLRFDHPVVAIHAANQPAHDGVPERTAGRDEVLVHRGEHGVRIACIEAFERLFLCRLEQGATLAEASDALTEGEAQSLSGGLLAGYVEAGVIAGWALATHAA